MRIQIFTTKSCSYCHKAKEYFKSKGLEFESYDIGENQEKRKEIIDAGYVSVPIIKVNEEVLVGWDKDKFEALMEKSS